MDDPVSLPNKTTLLSSSYPKIEGEKQLDGMTFSTQNKPYKIHFFEQLSDAAAQIHSVPLAELPFQLPTKIDFFEKEMFKGKTGDNYLPKKLFRKLIHNSFLGLGKRALRTSLLVHTDLHSLNVLLNDQGKLVAVLDFDNIIRGDRFLEFRPGLYEDPLDNRLFQRVYQERTGIKIDMGDIYQQEIAQISLQWFYNLYQSYRYLTVSDRNEKMKRDFKQKIAAEKRGGKCF